MKYKKYSVNNIEKINDLPGIRLDDSILEEIQVMSNILPFKTNNYVIEHLIDWNKYENDPIFRLNFPVREMVRERQYDEIYEAMKNRNREYQNYVIR